MIEVIYKTKIDFDALDKWRDSSRGDIPPVSCIGIYKALGIVEKAIEYKEKHPEFEVVPLDNIFCNLSTHKRIREFLKEIWRTYSLKLDADNHIYWDTRKYKKGTKHYVKTLSKTIEASLYDDFVGYAPGIDDNLGVNEIVLGILVPDEEEGEA